VEGNLEKRIQILIYSSMSKNGPFLQRGGLGAMDSGPWLSAAGPMGAWGARWTIKPTVSV